MHVTDDTPARRLTMSEIGEGDRVTQDVTFDQAELDRFIELAQDSAAHHTDDEFARSHGLDGKVVHGLLLASRFSRLLGMYLPGETSVIQTLNLSFRAPVTVGQALAYSISVSRIVPAVNAVLLDLSIDAPESGTSFVTGTSQCVVLTGD